MSRADKFSPLQKQVYYSDFMDNFDVNPITGFLAKKINEESIKASLKKLLLTNRGERAYNPLYGSNIRNLLFDLDDGITEFLIENEIRDTIQNWEPRVSVNGVQVTMTDNSAEIDVAFSIVNISQAQVLSFVVERVR